MLATTLLVISLQIDYSELFDIADAFVKTLPVWLIIIGVIVFVVVKYYSNIRAMKHDASGWYANVNVRQEQKKAANNVQKMILSARNTINESVKETVSYSVTSESKTDSDILPYDLEIKWGMKRNAKLMLEELQKGKVLIVLKDVEEYTPNIVYAIEAYVVKSLIPKTKKYLTEDVRRAIDLTMTNKILGVEFEDALEYFNNKVYESAIKKCPNVRTFVEALSTLDAKGLFTRLFLKELYDFGMRHYPQIADRRIR